MCSARKNSTSSSPVASPLRWLFGPGRSTLIVAILIAAFAGGAYLAWLRLGAQILIASEYWVGPERVDISPLPAWIHRPDSEFQREVFRDPTLDGPQSLMDDALVDRIAKAFVRHPWVYKVHRVSKRNSAAIAVTVDLTYRRPVCMVEVPGGVHAVDAEGVLLPREDFTPNEAARYPRLVGVDREPTAPPGRQWADARVIGGAEIAAALAPVWEKMNLHRIVVMSAGALADGGSAHGRQALEPLFALLTRSQTQIVWGYAPGASHVIGEPTAKEKLARLDQYFADHDTLDGPNGQPQKLDVRSMGKR